MNKNIINSKLEKVFCITCCNSLDRQQRCIEQFNHINLEYEFVPSINKEYLNVDKLSITKPEFSLLTSHLSCFYKAKLHKLTNFAIIEDDIEFDSDKITTEFESFYDQLPINWEILYLGHAKWLDGIFDTKKNIINSHVSLCKYGCGTNFMAFKNTIYDTCIEKLSKLIYPVDLCYQELMSDSDICYTCTVDSFADALSAPDKQYENRILNFNRSNYINSLIGPFRS
jgi:hypothetical protein